jgi:predicted transcriptional regulator
MAAVTVQLSDDDLQKLAELAKQRGVDANTVLQQAISTEKLIADNVQDGDDLLIKKKDNSYSRIVFSK